MAELRTEVSRGLDDRGFERITVKTPKMKSKIYILKARNGFSSYEVQLEQGRLPNDLSGTYTTPDSALKFVLKFIETRKDSPSVQRDKKYKRRHASKLPKDNS